MCFVDPVQGNFHYSSLIYSKKDWTWFYSSQKLQSTLRDMLLGRRIKNIFLTLDTLRDTWYAKTTPDCVMTGCSPAAVMIVTDSFSFEFCIHGEGLASGAFYSSDKIAAEECYGSFPEYSREKKYFYDLVYLFEYQFADKIIKQINVDGTYVQAFSLNGFDENKADYYSSHQDLPKNIHFITEDDIDICFCADYTEYFNIIINDVAF